MYKIRRKNCSLNVITVKIKKVMILKKYKR
jgi:hypothetical protein